MFFFIYFASRVISYYIIILQVKRRQENFNFAKMASFIPILNNSPKKSSPRIKHLSPHMIQELAGSELVQPVPAKNLLKVPGTPSSQKTGSPMYRKAPIKPATPVFLIRKKPVKRLQQKAPTEIEFFSRQNFAICNLSLNQSLAELKVLKEEIAALKNLYEDERVKVKKLSSQNEVLWAIIEKYEIRPPNRIEVCKYLNSSG